jgi:hypothetical protein
MSTLSRRHFLISGGAALGACFLPQAFLRRVSDHLANTNQVLIEGPARIARTLYATVQESGKWQLALGLPTTEYPPAPTWRVWLEDHEYVDVDDKRALKAWMDERGEEPKGSMREWLDSEVDAGYWEGYIESGFAVNDSTEAQALEYLDGLDLAHGPIIDSAGRDVGTLDFYHGTMPGADWHFVEAEGELILPALQHRLRELGEATVIKLV